MAGVLCPDVMDSDDDYLVPFPKKSCFKHTNLDEIKANNGAKMDNFTIENLQNYMQDCGSDQDNSKVYATTERIQFGNLLSSDDEDLLTEKLTEVTISGQFMRATEYDFVEVTFMTYSISLKMLDDNEEPVSIHWPLNEIRGFRQSVCLQTNDVIFELDFTDSGIERLQLKFEDFQLNIGNPLTIKVNGPNWDEQERRITSLSDGYKCLWRPGKASQTKQDFNLCQKTNKEVVYRRHGMHLASWIDLVFPQGGPDAVTITMNDFLHLDHQDFVNDTIIDFYIKFLESSLSKDEKKQFHFFNSFFFRKLRQDRSDKYSSVFDGVKRWTKYVDIFDKRFLFIPIMKRAHWSLVVVCYPGHLFNDEHKEEINYKKTSILHFDSYQGCHRGLEGPIRRYLVEHWYRTHSLEVSNNKKSPAIDFIRAEVPQQDNCFDCGLFMLHCMEMFIKAFCCKQPRIHVSRKWFDPADAAIKRIEIQRVIKELQNKELCSKMET